MPLGAVPASNRPAPAMPGRRPQGRHYPAATGPPAASPASRHRRRAWPSRPRRTKTSHRPGRAGRGRADPRRPGRCRSDGPRRRPTLPTTQPLIHPPRLPSAHPTRLTQLGSPQPDAPRVAPTLPPHPTQPNPASSSHQLAPPCTHQLAPAQLNLAQRGQTTPAPYQLATMRLDWARCGLPQSNMTERGPTPPDFDPARLPSARIRRRPTHPEAAGSRSRKRSRSQPDAPRRDRSGPGRATAGPAPTQPRQTQPGQTQPGQTHPRQIPPGPDRLDPGGTKPEQVRQVRPARIGPGRPQVHPNSPSPHRSQEHPTHRPPQLSSSSAPTRPHLAPTSRPTYTRPKAVTHP